MPLRSPTVRAVAALSLTQLVGWGATFWLPAVTGPAMASDLNLALPMVMAGPTVMLVVMGLVSWPLSAVFERYGARHGVGRCVIDTDAMVHLWQYDWPGNVRELESVIERVVVLSHNGRVHSADLPPHIRGSIGPSRCSAPTPPRPSVTGNGGSQRAIS